LTHAYLGLVAFDVMVAAVGYALLYGLGFVRRPGDALRYLGLAFFGGWTVTAVLLALGVTVGVDPDLGRVIAMSVAAGIVFVLAGRGRGAVLQPDREPSTSRLARGSAIAGAALLLLTLGLALREAVVSQADMSWDTWAFWLPKAEAIYYFHGLDTGLGGFTTYANPQYPPLVPVVDAASFHFMGGFHPALLPLQQTLLFAGFIGSLAVLMRSVPRWIVYPLLAALALANQLDAEVPRVMPDQQLAYLLALAAVCGILWLDRDQRVFIALGALFLAGGALTKDEGLLLGLLLAAVVLAAGFALRGRRAAPGLLLLLGPLAVVPWRIWLGQHHQPLSAKGVYSWSGLLHPGYLADRTGRLTYAVGHMVDLLGDPSRWSPVLPLTLAALIILAPFLRSLSVAVAAWIVVGFFGLASVYWISTPDIHWYVSTSADRVVGTLPVVAGAVLPLLLGIAVERERRTTPADAAAGASAGRMPRVHPVLSGGGVHDE
jgi:hypothetical protein